MNKMITPELSQYCTIKPQDLVSAMLSGGMNSRVYLKVLSEHIMRKGGKQCGRFKMHIWG